MPSGFAFESTAEDVARGSDFSGKVVAITGGHSGIGLETTRVLSEKGATVLVGARDTAKAEQAVAKFKNVRVLVLDLAEPASIDRFAHQILLDHHSIDVLVNNAGVMALPETRDTRGFEMQFSTNHLGHFQLTSRLMDALVANGGGRVVTLSSAGHRFSPVHFDDVNFLIRPYEKWAAYGQSKTANSLFAVELDRRAREHGVRSFAVHPGRIIETSLARHMTPEEFQTNSNASPALMKTIEQGAATSVWAATNPKLSGKGGVYCAECDISDLVTDIAKNPAGVLPYAVDAQAAKILWDLSEKMLGTPFWRK